MNFPFRSPAKNFAALPADTPYRRAQQEWDARMGSAVLSARSWRAIAFGCLGLTAVLGISLTAVALQKRTFVHVVEVSPEGQVMNVRAADGRWSPTEAQIAHHLGRFVRLVRSLPTDGVVLRENWLEAYRFLTPQAAAQLTEIARAVGLNVSTAHRLVRALCHGGFMEQEAESERYRLGFAIAVLGQRALEQSGYHLAQPILARLATTTGESASLGIRRGDEVLVLERAASVQPLRFDHPTGAEIHLHASAMGKVLLAFAPGSPKETVAALHPMERYTGHTITSRAALVQELTTIREQGFATNREERYEGVCGVAAPVTAGPVIAELGVAHAAVGIQGPSLRQAMAETLPSKR